jgi:integrase/recombinase XerD
LGDGSTAGEGREHRDAIGCHKLWAIGLTVYLTDGGTLEKAQQIAAHESKTTKLYDRTNDAITLHDVGRMAF